MKKFGRKLTTGRYSTRQELELLIWTFWNNTDMNVTEIADTAQVSKSTVSKIIESGARRREHAYGFGTKLI